MLLSDISHSVMRGSAATHANMLVQLFCVLEDVTIQALFHELVDASEVDKQHGRGRVGSIIPCKVQSANG